VVISVIRIIRVPFSAVLLINTNNWYADPPCRGADGTDYHRFFCLLSVVISVIRIIRVPFSAVLLINTNNWYADPRAGARMERITTDFFVFYPWSLALSALSEFPFLLFF
jgi:hypothetical protein